MKMSQYEERMKVFLKVKGIKGEHLSFDQSCHSVEEAAQALKVTSNELVKSICMIDLADNLIVAIVKGEDRASTSRVSKALGIERPRIATPQEILQRTGYPCGGTPSFGYDAQFLIDPKVMEKETVYIGGGSEKSLIKIDPIELQKANKGKIVRVRK